MSRFDYVKYDEQASKTQASFKGPFEVIAHAVESLKPGRAQALVLTKLEEAYMWIGKAVRDDQIARNGSAPLQEDRGPDRATPAPEPIERDEEHA